MIRDVFSFSSLGLHYLKSESTFSPTYAIGLKFLLRYVKWETGFECAS
jgi:hypothetical protein